jgi:LexA-binding, inner membrane-associated putative hydrolase
MLIGHVAVALGAKKAAPKTSFGTLLLAAQWPDLIWPLFLMLGWERVRIVPGITAVSPLEFTRYPLSHSLLADFGWGLVLAGLYLVFKKNQRGAFVIWACVMSHWLLDFVSHRPDLPLYPGSRLVGLGLWDSVSMTLIVEGGLFVAGVMIYSRTTRARDKTGEYGYKTFVALLVLIYLASLMGPPPPSVSAMEWADVFFLVFLAWAYWIDDHRTLATQPAAPSPPGE